MGTSCESLEFRVQKVGNLVCGLAFGGLGWFQGLGSDLVQDV